MEEQNEVRESGQRRYVSTGGGMDGSNRRSGFLPGVCVGILVAFIAVGILFALRGGSGSASGGTAGQNQAGPSGLSGFSGKTGSSNGTAVNDQTVQKLKLLEQYVDYYYYKNAEITDEQEENGLYKGLLDSLGDIYTCY